jgi:hypothetical protein
MLERGAVLLRLPVCIPCLGNKRQPEERGVSCGIPCLGNKRQTEERGVSCGIPCLNNKRQPEERGVPCGGNHRRRYRAAEEMRRWRARDPVTRFQRWLADRGWWDDAQDTAARQEARRWVLGF